MRSPWDTMCKSSKIEQPNLGQVATLPQCNLPHSFVHQSGSRVKCDGQSRGAIIHIILPPNNFQTTHVRKHKISNNQKFQTSITVDQPAEVVCLCVKPLLKLTPQNNIGIVEDGRIFSEVKYLAGCGARHCVWFCFVSAAATAKVVPCCFLNNCTSGFCCWIKGFVFMLCRLFYLVAIWPR